MVRSNSIRRRVASRAGKAPTRRTILKGAAASAAVAFTMKSVGPFVRRAEAAELNLRVLMWEPYNIKETIAEIEKDLGVRFSPTFFDGNSEAFNKMKAGGTEDFDMVQADGHWPRLYYKQGLTQAVDYAKLPSMKNAFSDFVAPNFPYFQELGGEATVAAPYCWGGYGVTINKSQVSDEDAQTLEVMFNEKYKGHLATSARFEENIAMAGILAADRMGTKDDLRPDGDTFNPYKLTDEELEEAKGWLIKQKGLLLTRYQDYDTLDRLMQTGVVWASPEFSETYRRLVRMRKAGELDFDVDHVLKAREGGLGWVDSWMISAGVTDAEKLEACHGCINHLLSKEAMFRVINDVGVPTTIDVRDMMSQEEIELLFMDRIDQIRGLYMFDQPSSPEKWERVWSEVEAA